MCPPKVSLHSKVGLLEGDEIWGCCTHLGVSPLMSSELDVLLGAEAWLEVAHCGVTW